MVIAEKPTKDLLTASKIGRYAINPYVGCPHACKYCYASFMKRFTNHPEAWGEFISEYWFEDLNLRGSYKPVIMRYVAEHYPNLYPMYQRIYDLGDRTELATNDRMICEWCDTNGINYSAYFHHEEVIKTEVGKILGKNRE